MVIMNYIKRINVLFRIKSFLIVAANSNNKWEAIQNIVIIAILWETHWNYFCFYDVILKIVLVARKCLIMWCKYLSVFCSRWAKTTGVFFWVKARVVGDDIQMRHHALQDSNSQSSVSLPAQLGITLLLEIQLKWTHYSTCQQIPLNYCIYTVTCSSFLSLEVITQHPHWNWSSAERSRVWSD